MNREPHSLALLRAANPVTADRVSADSPQAKTAFERIVADGVSRSITPPRRQTGSGRLVVPRFQLAAGSCAALLAAFIVVFVVISGSTASPAFAGWSATPTAPSQDRSRTVCAPVIRSSPWSSSTRGARIPPRSSAAGRRRGLPGGTI